MLSLVAASPQPEIIQRPKALELLQVEVGSDWSRHVGAMPVKEYLQLLHKCVPASHVVDQELMEVALGMKGTKMEQRKASCQEGAQIVPEMC